MKDIDETEKQREATFMFRYNMHVTANNMLAKYCKLHKINFINMENELLNKDKTLKAKFYSAINIQYPFAIGTSYSHHIVQNKILQDTVKLSRKMCTIR